MCKKTNAVMATFAFIYNVPSNFIERTWKDNEHLINHFKSKFIGQCHHEGYASANAVMSFYSELTDNNREKLAVFINDWYKNEFNK